MSYDILFNKALQLHEAGQFEEAEQIYRQILETAPEQPDVLNLLGLVAQAKGVQQEACDLFARAIKANPDNPAFYYNLAFSLRLDGKPHEALQYFSKVISLRPEMPEVYNETAQLRFRLGQVDAARQDWARALSLNPEFAEAAANLADSYSSENPPKAIAELENVVRKTLLPNYAEFNDYRHFEPSEINSESRITKIGNKNAGIIVCEDGWNDKDFFDKNLYKQDPVQTVVDEQHPDYLINCSSSITRAKKEQLKHNMLSFAAKKHKTPIIYVNQTGSGECMSFEGASRVYNNTGKLIAMAKSYKEQFFIVSPTEGGQINPLPKGLEKTLNSQKAFTLDHEPDLERTYLTIVQSIHDYFKKTGFKRAVLGLSGGLDSTVCAVLLADAIGKENVFGISMPSKITSNESRSDAEELAHNLGINFTEASIKPMVDTTTECLDKLFETIETKWKKYWDSRSGMFIDRPNNIYPFTPLHLYSLNG